MAWANVAHECLLFLAWALALAWMCHAVAALRGMATIPDLTTLEITTKPAKPKGDSFDLTVIVPACNEEDSIAATLRSLLASTGVRVEVIAVNDRSTDSTSARIDEVAAETATATSQNRLRVVGIRELPAGWLGKPHAMAQAAQLATTPWLLFTDGDVIFHPEALSRALAHTEAEAADHLVLVPTLIVKTAREAGTLAAMNVLAEWTLRLWKVADPRARDFIGVGGFNLIRREVYEQLGGFEALRMEVLDDLRLGWMVKRNGYRQRVAVGPGLVSIRWLQGARAIVRLFEKNGFAAFQFRVGLTLLAGIGLFVQAVLPLIGIAAGGWTLVAGLLTYVAIAMAYWANRRVVAAPPWVAVLFSPAALLVLYAGFRSMVLALARKGVVWRGTLYPLDELRSNSGRSW